MGQRRRCPWMQTTRGPLRDGARLALAAAVGALSVVPLGAQTLGALRGLVVDERGGPIVGATVALAEHGQKDPGRGVLTDRNGAFQVAALAPGNDYEVSAVFPGFSKIVVSPIEVNAGRTSTIRIVLPAATSVGEHVEVRARAQAVDTESTTTETRFSAEFIESLPIIGRNYQDVLSLSPGVTDVKGTGNPNIHGARDTDVRTTVDGVSTVDPLTGKVGQQLNIESIDEIEIKTSGATAEYGRAQGGFVNIVTKSGGNEFAGTFKFFWRGSALDGQGAGHTEPLLHWVPGAAQPAPLRFNDYRPFLSVGGPIRRDKAWYYVTMEYVQRQDPVNFVSQSFVQTTREKRVFGKFTWDLTAGQKMALTATIDPQDYDNQGLDSLSLVESGYREKQGGRNLVLKDTAIINPDIFLESTFQSFASTPRQIPTLDPDTNHNGRLSRDANHNGMIEATELDAGQDWDRDGAWDVFEDLDHNHQPNNEEDVDHDGRLNDSSAGCEGETREDRDCDGHLDTIDEDTNHNGILDPLEDRDGDNRLDDGTEDRNRNGHLDDRPFPRPNDRILGFQADGTPITLPPYYPYDRLRPLPPDRPYTIIKNHVSGPFYYDFDSRRKRAAIRQDLSLFIADWHGTHDIKVGGLVEREGFSQGVQERPIFYPAYVAKVNAPPPPLYVQLGSDASNQATSTSTGLYVQDTYKPIPNLTLSAGVRFDREVVHTFGYAPFDPAAERALYNRLWALSGGEAGMSDVFGNGDGLDNKGYCSDPIFSGVNCTMDPPGSTILHDLGRLGQIALSRMTQHHTSASVVSSALFGLYPDLVVTDPVTGEKTLNIKALRDDAHATFQERQSFALTNNNLAPRLSVAWAPGANGRTKLFVNWSRFYDKLFLNSVVGEQGPDTVFRYYRPDADGVTAQNAPDFGIGQVTAQSPPSTTQVDRNLKTPYADELTLGFEREIAPEVVLKLTYVQRDYRDQLQDMDINHYVRYDAKGHLIDVLGGFVGTHHSPDAHPDLYNRDFFFNQILRVGNFNTARYRGIEVEVIKRLSRRWQLEGSYTYSRAVGAAEDFRSVLGDDPSIVQNEFGYLDYDQRHVVKLNAAAYLPGDWQIGTVMSWSSGLPYSIVDVFAATDDVDYPQYRTFYGYYDQRTKEFISLRRNSERNSAVLNIDVRAQKALVVGRYNSKIFLSVQNLLNRDDLTVSSSIPPDSLFQTRRFGRRFELGMQFDF